MHAGLTQIAKACNLCLRAKPGSSTALSHMRSHYGTVTDGWGHNSKAPVLFPRVPHKIKLYLPIVETYLFIHTLSAPSPIKIIYPSSAVSWDHLPNKWFTIKTLSQGLLLWEHKPGYFFHLKQTPHSCYQTCHLLNPPSHDGYNATSPCLIHRQGSVTVVGLESTMHTAFLYRFYRHALQSETVFIFRHKK